MATHKEILLDVGIPVCENENNSWKPLMRQCMISVGMFLIYLVQGLALGSPTVIIAQMRKAENNTLTDETVSWLSSMPTLSAEPTILILPWISYKIGRRYTFAIISILLTIGFFIFYISRNLYQILISEVFAGTVIAAANSIFPLVMAEYSSPKYRGIFLTFKSASAFWGIWIANAIGTFLYWKNIAIVAFAVCAYFLTVLFWPESPYWLAMKGRYVECAESHRWLKGVNKDSEKELATLIKHQMKRNIKTTSREIDNYGSFVSRMNLWSTVTSRYFYKPVLVCMIVFGVYQFSGKFVISIYAIQVLKRITNDESVAFKGMLILDGFTVFSMYGGSIISRYCKRRTMLLLFSSISASFLYIISFYLYLVSFSIVIENHVIVISLLIAYSVAVGMGPMILTTTIYGEIIPLHFQNSITTICGFCNLAVMSILLKLSPFMVKSLLMPGYFLFFAISSTVVIFLAYIYLPETKDRTIHEIEECFVGNHISEDQTKNLLMLRK